MKIEKKLPQFENEIALIVATGEQTAKFYLAGRGAINELEVFFEPNPEYTDREGFFEKRMRKDYGSGSVYEPKKEYVQNKFLRGLLTELKNAREKWKFEAIYFFFPDFVSKEILSALPDEFLKMVRLKITGNFFREHPFKLLRMIQREMKIGENEALKKEARRLLKATDDKELRK